MKIIPEFLWSDDCCYLEYDNGTNTASYFDLNDLEKPFFHFKKEEINEIINKKNNTNILYSNYKLGPKFVFDIIKQNISDFKLSFHQSINSSGRKERTRIDIKYIPDYINTRDETKNDNVFFEINYIAEYDEKYFPNTYGISKRMSYFFDNKGSIKSGVDINEISHENYEEHMILEFIRADNEIYENQKNFIRNLYPNMDDLIRKEIPYFFSAKDLNLL